MERSIMFSCVWEQNNYVHIQTLHDLHPFLLLKAIVRKDSKITVLTYDNLRSKTDCVLCNYLRRQIVSVAIFGEYAPTIEISDCEI